MKLLVEADDIDKQINDMVAYSEDMASGILRKLRKFKANSFKPKVKGVDSDSDNEEAGTGLMSSTISPHNMDKQQLALIRLFQQNSIDENIVSKLIYKSLKNNRRISGDRSEQPSFINSDDRDESKDEGEEEKKQERRGRGLGGDKVNINVNQNFKQIQTINNNYYLRNN
mmetsp:Transcript_18650/g.17743  ORF Transcript_18650/g.17743 Transcript_18650/m.17743 type:complete len:170 (+) Transcript_18650:1242-1751(+)